ncbi:MAG: hypothetical protein R3293_09575 [Candidatus Promineifilaceae bacterium]|nr:hypothetical protein [Candidatus Promineifilaceae bacterium]
MQTYLIEFKISDVFEQYEAHDLKAPLKAEIENIGGKLIGLWFKLGREDDQEVDEGLLIYELKSNSDHSEKLMKTITTVLGGQVDSSSTTPLVEYSPNTEGIFGSGVRS